MAHPPLDFRTLQKIFLGIGTASLAVSVLMVFKFGYAMSVLHAVGLALASIACAFIFPAADWLKKSGSPWGARSIFTLGVFLFALELFAHIGYTVGQRSHSTDVATVQTAAYENRQEQLASNKANLTLWRQQLADLKAANAWAAQVSADGLRASLESATKAVELEEQRGGCKSKCLALMKQKAETENRIAVAEQVSDLTKRIEATQRIIDKHTEVAVETKKGFSPVSAQTDFVSQLYLLSTTAEAEKALRPDSVTLTVSGILIGTMLAIGMAVLAPGSFYIAFCKARELAEALSATVTPAKPETPAQTTSNVVPGTVVVRETVRDNAWLKEFFEKHPAAKQIAA